MAHVLFFAAAIAACLFWTAACVAAAARTERRWLRRLLAAVGMFLPLILLLPWVGLTGALAASGTMPTNNWFAPTLTAFLSALIGGWWICRAGLARAGSTDAGSAAGLVAAAWPLFGLAAMYLIAEAVTYGTLVSIDHESLARSRALRAEAAQLMQASLPPAPAADDDAAPLYERALAAIEADKELADEKSPFWQRPSGKQVRYWNPLAADVNAADVQATLTRHAPTLKLVRRAADKPGCRLLRDWSRPSFSMQLPVIAPIRQAVGLLTLAARRAAADGDVAAALRDVVRIHRIGMHVAGEPVLITGMMGTAIDTNAIETLAAVLPAIGGTDLPLLDEPTVVDFLGTIPSYRRHFYGEEAFGIAALADSADGSLWGSASGGFIDTDNSLMLEASSLRIFFRWFFLPAYVTGYREVLHRYQAVASLPTDSFPEISRQLTAIESDIERRQVGLLGPYGGLMLPALGQMFRVPAQNRALHRAAEVLVAATRFRIATGGLPESAAALVPAHLPAVPRDPFTVDAPLRSRRTDDGRLVVYSVGLDGEDDGGPPPRGSDRPEGNDDVGLAIAP